MTAGGKAAKEEAVGYFLNSYNCAQSVLLTMARRHKVKSNLIPKIATGLGGGVGLCGSICGALTGGILAIGMEYGSNEPSQKERAKCYELAGQLYKRFERLQGTVLCRDLIGYDLSKTEELDRARTAKAFEKKCPEFVRTVVQILLDLESKTDRSTVKRRSPG